MIHKIERTKLAFSFRKKKKKKNAHLAKIELYFAKCVFFCTLLAKNNFTYERNSYWQKTGKMKFYKGMSNPGRTNDCASGNVCFIFFRNLCRQTRISRISDSSSKKKKKT
jgi:hypothetical protein